MSDEELFERVRKLPLADRGDFVARNSMDAAQADRVVSLLVAYQLPDSLLDTSTMRSPDQTSRAASLPKQIGDFEIRRELGRGGMGVVYEAYQKSLKRKVALKILSNGLGLSSKAILRFRREAEAAGKLHHTNIVPIYTTGEDKGIHFYAMELIDGPSLDQVIAELKLPSENGSAAANDRPSATAMQTNISSTISTASGTGYFDSVATMIADVAEALDHAHEHGVIHRDVKPSNLLLGPDGRLSINDFGLARMLEQPGMTVSGEFVGSPLYMSPEQITAGRVQLDHRTDIYSLGATLYEILTLQPPFPGQNRDQVLSQILHKEAISTRKVNRKVPSDLDTICMKAIDKDPDRRYQTAGKMAEDLRNYVNRFAISARRIGPLGKSYRWLRRHPSVAFSMLTVLLSTAILFGVVWNNRFAQKQAELSRVSSDMFKALLRADRIEAQKLLKEGQELGAPHDWLNFSRGVISLFESEYVSARSSLGAVDVGDDNYLAARALLAVAHMWSGDEKAYLLTLRDVDPESVSGFVETLCAGYAHCWGKPQKAVELLERAESIESNHPLTKVFLAQARRLRAMDIGSLDKARLLIEKAIADLETQRELANTIPLVAMETAMANIVAHRLYRSLGDEPRASERLEAALAMRAALDEFDRRGSPKVPYVLIMLASHASPQNTEELHDRFLELHDRWKDRDMLQSHACNWMALNLLQVGEFDLALAWLERRTGPNKSTWKFLDRYVRYLDPAIKEPLESLRQEAEEDLQSNTQYKIPFFDVTQIALFGGDDSMLHFIQSDENSKLISDFRFNHEFFGVPKGQRNLSPEELLEKCNESDRPVFHRMHANFYLAIESLAESKYDTARQYFEACHEDIGIQFCVHRLSKAFLERIETK